MEHLSYDVNKSLFLPYMVYDINKALYVTGN